MSSISNLPVYNAAAGDECSFCYEAYTPGEKVAHWACGHVFHHACSAELKQCPLDEKTIVLRQPHTIPTPPEPVAPEPPVEQPLVERPVQEPDAALFTPQKHAPSRGRIRIMTQNVTVKPGQPVQIPIRLFRESASSSTAKNPAPTSSQIQIMTQNVTAKPGQPTRLPIQIVRRPVTQTSSPSSTSSTAANPAPSPQRVKTMVRTVKITIQRKQPDQPK